MNTIGRICAIFTAWLCLATTGQAAGIDSTSVQAAQALPASNCKNIDGAWYASGTVPAGYYKEPGSPYDCKPIPACTSNKTFNTASESCGCAAGTVWDVGYNECHATCPAGTAWNGSACTSVCTGGKVWSNVTSSCSCPVAGQVSNGTTCGFAPSISGWSMSPASQNIGSNFTLAWTISGGVSASVSCTGANAATYSLSPVNSGSGSLAATKAGTTACTVTATNSYGSDTATDSSTSVCPAPKVWSNVTSACGVAPTIGSFSMTPAAPIVDDPYTITWSASGASTVTMSCTGATAASNTLSPPAGGSGSLNATKPGTTTCTATATNPYGSVTASDSGTANCAAGSSWDGTSCAIATDGNGGNPSGFGSVYAQSITFSAHPASAAAGIQFVDDGRIAKVSGTSYTYVGNWYFPTTAGIGSKYAVMATGTADASFYSGGLATWYSAAGSSFIMKQSMSEGFGEKNAALTFHVKNLSSGKITDVGGSWISVAYEQ